jgi:chromosome segregation ATPase
MQAEMESVTQHAATLAEQSAGDQAAVARCQELEVKLSNLGAEFGRAESVRKRAVNKQTEAEEAKHGLERSLKQMQLRLTELERSLEPLQSELEHERADKVALEITGNATSSSTRVSA